jgi:glycoside/pentoside/hexuronide:cation symporter, GPH family
MGMSLLACSNGKDGNTSTCLGVPSVGKDAGSCGRAAVVDLRRNTGHTGTLSGEFIMNAASRTLSVKTKLGFGVCDLGGNLFFTMMGFYLLFFLTDYLGLRAGLAGIALMIGKVWDAVSDPITGYISDRTVSPWGRRRPYIFVGSFLLAAMMVVMFLDPGIRSQRGLFIWVTVMYCLLNTAYTLVNIPYGALTPEITTDFHERTVLNGYRMVFAVVGTFIGAGLVLPIVRAFPSPATGWPVMGAVTGGIMGVTALITFFTVSEPNTPAVRNSAPIFGSYLEVLRQKTFLTILVPWASHVTGINIIQAALLYYFRVVYGREEAFQIALPVLLGAGMIWIPIWVRISRRIGKKLSYNLGMGIFTAVILVFFAVGHRSGMNAAFVMMGLAGIGFATQYVMPYSMIPDVVEYDFAETGFRREGVYYGLWTFISKIGQAFGIALSGWVLSWFGYIPPVPGLPEQAQPALARLGIRLLVGPVPALFFVIGITVLAFYPINARVYNEILEKIRTHQDTHNSTRRS